MHVPIKWLAIILLSSFALGQGVVVNPKVVIGPKGIVSPGTAATENIVLVDPIVGTAYPNTSNGVAQYNLVTTSVANELVYIVAFIESSSQSTSSCTDSASDTYTQIDEQQDSGGGNNMTLQTFYLHAAPAGLTYVKCTETNGVGYIYVAHVKGLTGAGTLDVHAITANGSSLGSPWNSPPVTTTVANEFLGGGQGCLFHTGNCNPTATGSWTMTKENDGGTGDGSSASYQTVSTIQTNIENTGTNAGPGYNWAAVDTFY